MSQRARLTIEGGYSRVPIRAAADRDLSGSALRVLIALGRFVNSDGECWPSIKTLAVAANLDRRHVPRSLRQLERAGFIVRKSRIDAAGDRGSNIYTVSFDPDTALGVTSPGDTSSTTHGETVSPSPALGVTSPGDTSSTTHGDTVSPHEAIPGVTMGGALSIPTVEAPNLSIPKVRDDGFDQFFEAYPKRGTSEEYAARKAWPAAIEAASGSEQIVAGARRYAEECRGRQAKFISRPSTWLAERRWVYEHVGSSTAAVDSRAADTARRKHFVWQITKNIRAGREQPTASDCAQLVRDRAVTLKEAAKYLGMTPAAFAGAHSIAMQDDAAPLTALPPRQTTMILPIDGGAPAARHGDGATVDADWPEIPLFLDRRLRKASAP
ncbi:MAG TPA: helix-turn-helix domain-containing protein [Stellaceae bacterium]|nr:helix-turn-helix domain-containing protein [Stellaceae bacterium]